VRFVRLCELIFARKTRVICQNKTLVSHKAHGEQNVVGRVS